jgi:outer membrane protein assembly factor BamD
MMRLSLSPSRLGTALLLLALAACSSNTKSEAYIEKPVDDLYNTAMDQLADEKYDRATKTFGEVESQHPYSVWATKSQLMAIYAGYEDGKYDQAILAADRFIQLHPGNPAIAYAYYVKAICYYVQITDVGRDQKTTEQAVRALEEVIRRFPNSKYARDAKLKLDFTHDHLAGKEMEIGRYYLRRGEYLAAMNRFRRVIDNYQTTTHVPEALERLVECDLGLGLLKEARENAAVLGYNYPGSRWYEEAYTRVSGVAPAGAAPPATASAPPGEAAPSGEPPHQSWFSGVIGSLF